MPLWIWQLPIMHPYRLRQYSVSGLTVGLALLALLQLDPWLNWQSRPFLVLLAAVLLNAHLGGVGAGLLATVLSGLGYVLFLLPASIGWSSSWPSTWLSSETLQLGLFLLEGGLLSIWLGGLNQKRTEYKQSEQVLPTALSTSETSGRPQFVELNQIYKAAPIGLCFLDTELRFICINDWLAAINGRSVAEHIGRRLGEVVPEFADAVEPLYRQVLASRLPALNVELCSCTATEPQVERTWLVSYYPVIDAQDVLLGVSTVVQDITERKQAEAALRKNEAKFRRLVEANMFGVAFGDFSGRITYANEALLRMIGHTEADVLNGQLRWDRLTPSEYLPLDAHATEELRMRGVSTPFTKEYIRQDGSRVPILLGSALLAEPYDQQETIISFYLDLIELKQIESALQRQQERLNLAQKAGKIGTFEWDIATHKITWTQELEALYGLSPGCFGGQYQNWLKALHPADRLRTGQAVRKAMRTGTPLDTEFRIYWPDGSLHWMLAKAHVFQDGSNSRLIGVNVDITERKQAEESLQETNQTLQALIQACPLAIAVFSLDNGQVKLWNPAAELIFGWSEQEVLGCFLPSVPPDKRQEFLGNLAAIRQGQSLVGIETRRQKKNGLPIELSVWAAPLQDAEGRCNCVSIVADITERKQAEVERSLLLAREQAARAQAEAANRLKDEFLATLSHELRSPLNAMLGWAQLLRTRKFNAATTERALETIERNARLQTQLVEDLLDVSRIIQGRLGLNLSPVDLVPVIEAAIETVRPAAEAKNIQVRTELPAEASLLAGDAARLQQVIWNLLSNAIKFTPSGGQVEVQLSQNDEAVQLRVSDTGRGISADFLPYVFDRFRQADNSSTRTYGGLGLGLAIVRHLVELHGGMVDASSPGEGQGATFSVVIPLPKGALSSRLQANTQTSLPTNPEAPQDLPQDPGRKPLES
ncbi:PAS domain S-box protein [Leptolyngbya sp. FACHB-261]|uniref:PAS domain-containing sensor histidine kinase n=1 Tax=Leptolyngbya sp. FACHB-261 TaxID=2692806 RepID=UPI001683FA95|nr:PAS domain S-box protein [Leptolyngbya sp. FACHB-261]MBD2101871.1 PAS domain S-box protein [Leptolyngbya sp. FACHB-261]